MPRPAQLAGTYLAARTRFGIKFGLGTMRALLAEMGHPERCFPTLLVAGTNGKGSVVAYVDAVLRASGLHTGRYTSPHLVRLNERIVVGGREITDHALETAVARVRGAAERLVRAGRMRQHPTFFEALTAAAFEHFRQVAVDVAVLEVGMGGRLDATNVAEPLASAIVSIDFDHQAYLGTTLAAIAREKAGVLRRGRTTVVGPMPREARRAIATRARATLARPLARSARAVTCVASATFKALIMSRGVAGPSFGASDMATLSPTPAAPSPARPARSVTLSFFASPRDRCLVRRSRCIYR
jgi:dihydrofolate synthase/folylpolyglutamate synthase